MSYISLAYRDRSAEVSTVTIHTVELTAANLVAWEGDFTTLRAAMDALVIGKEAHQTKVLEKALISRDIPASEFAQRENKWLVSYEGDTSHKLFSIEIPTADLALRNQGNDSIDITVAPFDAFVTAFEDLARSPDDPTETVSVRAIKFVGRNL
jgi:hypothetical protein